MGRGSAHEARRSGEPRRPGPPPRIQTPDEQERELLEEFAVLVRHEIDNHAAPTASHAVRDADTLVYRTLTRVKR
jgi:hypothetical protein